MTLARGRDVHKSKLGFMVMAASGVPAAAKRLGIYGGIAVDNLDRIYLNHLGSTAVSGGRKWKGFAFTDDDALCVTNDDISATSKIIDGIAVRHDGAVHISNAAAVHLSYFGWSDASNKLCLDADFALPLADAGDGAVDTTPMLGTGSATFTRNTTAYALLSNGLYGLVDANVARGQYSPAGVYLGYLAEGARADELGTTAAIRRTMANVGWVATNITVGAATGADGVASAGASLTASAANGTIKFTTVLAAAVRTYSAWVRRKTGTGTVNITGDNGVTWTAITLTTTYTQFSFVTASAANPIVGFRIVTDTDAIEVDFNTLEAAAFANPTPIPVNVSKATDLLTYPTSGNIIGTTGSCYAEAAISVAAVATNVVIIGIYPGSGNGGMPLRIITDTVGFYDGTVNRTGVSFTGSNVIQKIATSWGGTSGSTFVGGSSQAASGFDGDMGIDPNMVISGQTDGSGVNSVMGTIKNVRIWQRSLPDATLQAMTT